MKKIINIIMLITFNYSVNFVYASEVNEIESGYVTVSHELTLFYQQSGHGDKTILYIPGWTMSTEVYQHQLGYFKNSTEWRFIR